MFAIKDAVSGRASGLVQRGAHQLEKRAFLGLGESAPSITVLGDKRHDEIHGRLYRQCAIDTTHLLVAGHLKPAFCDVTFSESTMTDILKWTMSQQY